MLCRSGCDQRQAARPWNLMILVCIQVQTSSTHGGRSSSDTDPHPTCVIVNLVYDHARGASPRFREDGKEGGRQWKAGTVS